MSRHKISIQEFDDWEHIEMARASNLHGLKILTLMVHPHTQAVQYELATTGTNPVIFHSLGKAIEAYNAIQL
jgi:hypothetical protein